MEGTDELFSLPWWKIGFARVPEGGGGIGVVGKEFEGDLERQLSGVSVGEKLREERIENVVERRT